MRIRRLLLRSFGCLRGEFHFSADRINLILEPNEKGKSTLAAAILAALYGFPPGQRRSEGRPIVDADVHRPWSGEGYYVEMDLEVEGRGYTIKRDFARREERVLEWKTGKDITAEFQAGKEHMDFAGILTGLTREEFAKTVFLRQAEMQEIRSPGGLTAALQRVATSQQGDVAAAEAIEILSQAVRQYRGRKIRRGKVESEIQEIDEEISVLAGKLDAMEDRRRKAEERILELKATSREEGRNEDELNRLEYLILAAGLTEDRRRMEEETREREELQHLEEQFQELQSFAEFPSESRGRLLELKTWLSALAEEEARLVGRAREEEAEPLRELEERAAALQGISVPGEEEMERLATIETDLLAAWKTRRDVRRARRAMHDRWREKGFDPEAFQAEAALLAGLTPEDRRFLRDYAAKEIELRSGLTAAEREADDAAEELGRLEERVGAPGGSRTALAAASAIAFLAAAASWMAGWSLWIILPAALIGAGLLAMRALTAGPPIEPSEEGLLQRESLAACRRRVEEISAAVESMKASLESIAGRIGAGSGERLLEKFRDADARTDDAAEMASLARQASDASRNFEEAAAAIRPIMARAGFEPRFGAVTPAGVRRFRKLASERAELAGEIEELKERLRHSDEEIAKLAGERRSTRSEVEEILSRAGIEAGGDLEKAAVLFEEGIKRRDRYETLKKEVIPGLVRRSLSHRGEPLMKAVETAEMILRRKREDDASLAGLQPDKSHREYVEQRDALRKEAKLLVERRLALSGELGEVLREYRRDYPDTQRWLTEWREQKERAEAFRSAVQIASEVLEGISREAYAEWADVLNERASDALALMAPGYGDLRFDESLSFTIADLREGNRRTREDVDRRFSAGTKDQIYLAARLAFASYLSAGKIHMPLILDDPFASFDDQRFAGAMSMLIDKFAKRHQIVILSCHETRHRAWQDRNAGRSAERVRLMTLQALAT